MQHELLASPLLADPAHLGRAAVVGAAETWTWRQVHEASIVLARRIRRRVGRVQPLLVAARPSCHAAGDAAQCRPDGAAAVGRATPTSPRCSTRSPHDRRRRRRDRWRPGVRERVGRASMSTAGPNGSPLRRATAIGLAAGVGRVARVPAHVGQHRRAAAAGEDAAAPGDRRTLLGARLSTGGRGRPRGVERIVCSVPPQHMFGLECSVMLSLFTARRSSTAVRCCRRTSRAAFADVRRGAWIATPMHLRSLVQAGARCRGAPSPSSRRCRSARPRPPVRAPACRARARDLRLDGNRRAGDATHRARNALVAAGRREPRSGRGRHARSRRALRVAGAAARRVWSRRRRLHAARPASRPFKFAGRRASLAGLNLLLQDLPGLGDGVFYLPRPAIRPSGSA